MSKCILHQNNTSKYYTGTYNIFVPATVINGRTCAHYNFRDIVIKNKTLENKIQTLFPKLFISSVLLST